MTDVSADELTMLAGELNKAWTAYTAHVYIAPQHVRTAKDRLAAIIIRIWKQGVTENIAEAALREFEGE